MNPRFSEIIAVIKNSPTVRHNYSYGWETGNINPAYQESDHFTCLPLNEKRIWALRSDMILATGIKQIYVEEGNTNLRSKLIGDEKNIDQISKNDQFGHTSLAIPENNYDGTAYTAGWIAQRTAGLEIFLASGHFHNDYLTAFQRQCIEIYIAKKFMDAHGKQDVVFYDFDKTGLADFLKDKSLEQAHTKRVYTSDFIDGIDKLKEISPNSLSTLYKSVSNNGLSTTAKTNQVLPLASPITESKSAPVRSTPQPQKHRSHSVFDSLVGLFKSTKSVPMPTRKILVAPRKTSVLQ